MKKRRKIQSERSVSWPIPASTALAGLSTAAGALPQDWLNLDPINLVNLREGGGKELAFARAFNFQLPLNSQEALHLLENLVCEQMDVERCQIHLSNKTLQTLPFPGINTLEHNVLSRALVYEGRLLGQVRLFQPRHDSVFSLRDQIQFDLLLPYLVVQVQRLCRQQPDLPEASHRAVRLESLLTLAEQLLKSSDIDSIMSSVLTAIFQQFDVLGCQYLARKEDEPEKGELFYEIRVEGASMRRLHSYSHAALRGQRRIVSAYSAWLSHVLGQGGPIFLNADQLGNVDFGMPGVQGLYLCPIINLNSNEPLGLLCLLSPLAEAALEPVALACIEEMAHLASQACTRALQVEASLKMATQDELTGLMTRRAYYQRFDAEMERARRHQVPLTVALIDVDHFKRFNDRYGHLSGDLVLKELAGLLMQNLRKSDIVCRFGGEEFAILLPDTTLKDAVDLLERVRQSVAQQRIPDFTGQMLQVTMSAGLAEVNTRPHPGGIHDNEMVQALALADEQLYRAKAEGRNQVCFPA
jgi:diguanylate cyclase (GGDEF)-like protein